MLATTFTGKKLGVHATAPSVFPSEVKCILVISVESFPWCTPDNHRTNLGNKSVIRSEMSNPVDTHGLRHLQSKFNVNVL